MRVLKESFNALIQLRAEEVTNNYESLDSNLLHALESTKKQPNPENLRLLLAMEESQTIVNKVLTVEDGTEALMTLAYYKIFHRSWLLSAR